MPIEIRYYNNLFWSEGNIKPNQLPSPDKREVVPRQPTMYDFANGYLKLYGVWNYAIYKGKHYFLEIVKRYDEDKQSYGYAMRLDYWMEALYKRPSLKGILNVSNNDELLEKYLQYTQPTLVDPTEATRLNFEESERKWYENLHKKEAETAITQAVVTQTHWDYFIKSHTHGYAKQYINDWRDRFFNWGKTDAIYIFSYLQGETTSAGWKNLLRKRVNEFLKGIGENQKIAKVVTPEGSALVGKYCITDKQGGIGGGDENVIIDTIDLSGLSDIREVRATDLQPAFLSFIEFGEETAVISDVENTLVDINFGLKLCRKFYGSFIGQNDNTAYHRTGLASSILDNAHYLYYGNKAYITNYIKVGRSNVSAAVMDSVPDPTIKAYRVAESSWGSLKSTQFLKFKSEEAGVETHVKGGITYWVDRINFEISWRKSVRFIAEKYHKPNYLTLPYPRIENVPNDSEYYFTQMDNPPGFGFLIYQTIRPWNSWNTIEYTSTVPLTKLSVITGIKDSFNRDYKWDSSLPYIVENSDSKLGNMGVLLFYLDLYSFLYLVPSYESWSYQYRYRDAISALKMDSLITESLTWYTNYDVTKNVRLGGKDYKPFSNTEYPRFAVQREQRLRDVVITETLDLEREEEDPRKRTFGGLNKGDYFFTDLEYALSHIDNRVPTRFNDVLGWGTERTGFNVSTELVGWITQHDPADHRRSIGILSDFVERDGDNDASYFDKLNKSGLVLCSTKERELEIRIFNSFKTTHKLSTDRNQILYSVNENTFQQVRYSKLKNLGIKVKPSEPISPEDRRKILKAFYEHHNYQFHEEKWSWVPEAEIRNSSIDRIFDLVGTEWYCHIKGKKISLIAKSETLFKKSEYKTSKIKLIDKVKNLSLLEKINQRCYLTVHTQTRPIKTKFNFSHDSFFNVEVISAKPTRLQTGENNYIIHARNKFDVIDRDKISIPKIPEDAIDIATSAQIEQQRLIQLRAEQDYAIAAGFLDIKEDRVEEALRRNNWEVMMKKIDFGLSVPQTIVGGVIGASKYATALGRHLDTFDDQSTGRMFRKSMRLTWGAGANLATSIYENFAEEPLRWGEMQRRASFEQEVGIREINLKRSEIDFRAERAKQDSFIQINSLSNMHRMGLVNDAHIVKEMNKLKDLNDGQEMNDIHLVVYTPSKDQLEYLIPHKERHGVDCNIPNQTYDFFPGMREDVIRFKDLYSENIEELDNLEIRKKFLEMILTGVKIIDAQSEDHIKVLSEVEVLRHDIQLEKKDNQLLATHNHELEVKNTQLGQEVTYLTNANEGLKTTNSQLTGQVTQLTTENTQVKEQIEKKTAEVTKLQTDLNSATHRADTLSASVHKLEAELTQEKNVITLLNAELNKLRPQVRELTELKTKNTALTNKIKQLTNTVGNLANKVHNLTNQIVALTGGTIAWTYEGVPKPSENQSLEDQLNNLQGQLTELDKISTNVTTVTTGYTTKQEGWVSVDREKRNESAVATLQNVVNLTDVSGQGFVFAIESLFEILSGSNETMEAFFEKIKASRKGSEIWAKIHNKRNEMVNFGISKTTNEEQLLNFLKENNNSEKIKDVLETAEEIFFLLDEPLTEEEYKNKNCFDAFHDEEWSISPKSTFEMNFETLQAWFNWIPKKPIEYKFNVDISFEHNF